MPKSTSLTKRRLEQCSNPADQRMDPETAITTFVRTHTISSDPRVKQVRNIVLED